LLPEEFTGIIFCQPSEYCIGLLPGSDQDYNYPINTSFAQLPTLYASLSREFLCICKVENQLMFNELDPLLHSQVRLAIMTLLIPLRSAEFSYILENIDTTKGNLSFQLSKLREGGYIEIEKSFRNNYPLTTIKITLTGIDAYERYIESISDYFKHSGKA
jgi:DNA-binding transcriptional ArsR family regulator